MLRAANYLANLVDGKQGFDQIEVVSDMRDPDRPAPNVLDILHRIATYARRVEAEARNEIDRCRGWR